MKFLSCSLIASLTLTVLPVLSHAESASTRKIYKKNTVSTVQISGADKTVKKRKPKKVVIRKKRPSPYPYLRETSPALDDAQGYVPAGYLTKDVPAILSDNDVHLYKKMFKLQRNRQRTQVAKLVPQLNSNTLMGHLIAVRLLHPYTKTPYTDLKKWLDKYSDHSPAEQVYTLANMKRPRKTSVAMHAKPDVMKASIARYSDPDRYASKPVAKTKKRQALLRKLKRYRQNQYYTKAMRILDQSATKKMLGEHTWEQVGVKLARAMMQDGYDKIAEKMSRIIISKIAKPRPEALWIAGFTAYKQGKKKTASGVFRKLAYGVSHNSRYFAQGAWWAAKTYEELERDSMAQVFYNLAAQDPHSFYGQMAVERKGRDASMKWKEPRMRMKDRNFLFNDPVIRRVIALVQVGEHGLAQQEMKLLHERVPYDMDESLLALTTQLKLPNPSMTLARNLKEQGKVFLSGLYPEISGDWAPRGGYNVDKALLRAVSRQESAFNPYVVSRAGARGLMQLMPNTAKYIRKKQNRPVYSKSALLQPSVNMMLGQDYLGYLEKNLDGNLVHMISAYNAGPGNVRKWMNKGMGGNDPIFFIESIPFKETKGYVKKVFANLWMYRQRYQENKPTLTAMSQNLWPIEFVSLETRSKSASR